MKTQIQILLRGTVVAALFVLGLAHAQTGYWQDSFETYSPGTGVSAPWQGDGGGNLITTSQHASGAKALELAGSPGGCWAAICDREIPMTNSLYIEFSLRPSRNHAGGCHPWVGLVGLRTTRSWSSAQGYWFLTLQTGAGQSILGGYPGQAGAQVLSNWSYDQWNKIGVLYQNNQTNVDFTYFINGKQLGPYHLQNYGFENALKYLAFDSGDGTTWIDDVTITSAPLKATDLYITNATVTADGYANFEVVTPFSGVHSLLVSPNLKDWDSVATLEGPTNRFFVNSYPDTLTDMGNIFVRVALGLVPQFQFNLNLNCTAGTLVAGTPSVSFPQSVQSYSAFLEGNRIANPAAATNVFFTGPPGCGLTNALPEGSDLDPENYGANNWSPWLTNPSVPPPGRWTVSYGGTNMFFDQPDARTHFVIPHPTVVVSNGVLVSLDWLYRNPTTGEALSGAPAYMTELVVEVFGGTPFQRIYDSDHLSRGATNHVFSSTLLWSEVESLAISYSDDLVGNGNYYMVFYAK